MKETHFRKYLATLLILVGGFAIFVFGSPYYSIFTTNKNRTYILILSIFFLLLSLILKRQPRLSQYWPIAYSFFIASAATLFLNLGPLNINIPMSDKVQFIAIDKLSQFLHIVPMIILLSILGKYDHKSIFLSRGDLKEGLSFGVISFTSFALIALLLFRQSPDFFNRLLFNSPWLLLFIFANSIMEELWFRAIFLNKFADVIGPTTSIIVTSIVFGASHINATYSFPGGPIIYGLVVFSLGLFGANSMLKTGSIIGPVLFHAGYDLLIIFPILASV
jgi:membrane protease YdiL (CAAX protease family)